MALPRRIVLAGALAGFSQRARALRRPLRLGVLTTVSGPAADGAGTGSVLAARMAAEAQFDRAVEVLAADMGDRPEVGAGLARAWLDRDGVDAIVDVPNSATALAVVDIVRDRNRIALFSGPDGATLTGVACSPNYLQWTYDTAALAAGTAQAMGANWSSRPFHATSLGASSWSGPSARRLCRSPRSRPHRLRRHRTLLATPGD